MAADPGHEVLVEPGVPRSAFFEYKMLKWATFLVILG